jgi:MFS family permease
VLTVGGIIFVTTVLVCSFLTNPNGFILLFGIGLGIAKGLMYSSALFAAWTHLPGRKGLASGIIISGFGFGGFFLGYVSHHLCNPDNIKVVTMTTDSGHKVKLFPDEVSINVPNMLHKLGIIFLVLILAGVLMVSKFDDEN